MSLGPPCGPSGACRILPSFLPVPQKLPPSSCSRLAARQTAACGPIGYLFYPRFLATHLPVVAVSAGFAAWLLASATRYPCSLQRLEFPASKLGLVASLNWPMDATTSCLSNPLQQINSRNRKQFTFMICNPLTKRVYHSL